MKKHPFLQVDYQSTVKLSPHDTKKLERWFHMAGFVLEDLFKQKIVRAPKVKSVQLSLLICGDARIRKLNLEHRNKDKVTDVLSFPSNENLRKLKYNGHDLFLGDLAICHPQAKRQAKEFKIGLFDEFIHLFFHGVIHLLGYDHELSAKEEKLMQAWEEKALRLFSDIKKGAL